MEGRLGHGQAAAGRLVRRLHLDNILLIAVAALLASDPASAQVYGERPVRYGNTASFFFYDNRDDQRDFPANGVFPGNFAADRFFAGVGAAGWLGSNPQHSAAPYPSQSYFVAEGYRLSCPPPYRADAAAAGHPARKHRRHILCVAP
jgi:hypothetical protein